MPAAMPSMGAGEQLTFRQDQAMTVAVAALRAQCEASWASASIFATVNTEGLPFAGPPPIALVHCSVVRAPTTTKEDVGRSAADIAVPPPRSLLTAELRTWVRNIPRTS
jgi:hypothetical protein